MSDPFVGQLMTVGFGFAPRAWALCDGSLIPVSQNSALFSLLGTTFGGDGVNTFGLPDLRSRCAFGTGNGPGLTPVTWGQKFGAEQVTLNQSTLPNHSHNVLASSEGPTTDSPNMARLATQEEDFYTTEAGDEEMAPTGSTGGSQPFEIRNPGLGLWTVIALYGVYPSRS